MNEQVKELLYQMLETEMGGAQVYTTALQCVVNKDLKEEWTEYLEQTKHHIEVVRDLLEKFGLDPEQQTPGRQVVHHLGAGLVQAMQMATKSGKREGAELVACECVVLAETKGPSKPVRSANSAGFRDRKSNRSGLWSYTGGHRDRSGS